MPEEDYLLDAALENWPHILRMYRLFVERRPILLYDIQQERVYAYPFLEFQAEMSERSQRSLQEQYEQARACSGRDNKVFFVRDNEKRRLVSFSLDLPTE